MRLRFALDTGATRTLIRDTVLVAAGYDPAQATTRVQIITGSSVELVPVVRVSRIQALGQSRTDFPVLAHSPPSGLRVDGLLGLDFLRGCVLTLDFRAGQITLI
jgi:hypothetical protein